MVGQGGFWMMVLIRLCRVILRSALMFARSQVRFMGCHHNSMILIHCMYMPAYYFIDYMVNRTT